MKRSETVFLLAVIAFAAAFAIDSLTSAAGVIAREQVEGSFSPTAGEPRDVDMERLRRLIDAGLLSPKEAQHYQQVEEGPGGG